MSQLVRQRIKYLVEFGELYPREDLASKNFVAKAAGVVILFILADMLLEVLLTVR